MTPKETNILELSKRCPKKMKNGPCGSSSNGRCEVGGLCVWTEIYHQLKKAGNISILDNVLGAEKYGYSPYSDKKAPSFMDTKGFIVTTELDPPKGTNLSKIKTFLKNIHDISAINVVDNPLGKPLMSPLLPCFYITKHNITPIYQITCRDRNIAAIQSDIFAAYASGIRDILVLTGDYVTRNTKPVYDIDSTILAYLIKTKLPEGQDFTGEKTDTKIIMNVGIAVNPNAEPLDMELTAFRKKMQFADFAQTQAIFDPDILDRFSRETNHHDKTLIGILPITSYKMAEAISKVPGISIPDAFIEEIRQDKNAGIKRAKELIAQAKTLGFKGVHLMTFTDHKLLSKLMKSV